jgi:hypothetical protein
VAARALGAAAWCVSARALTVLAALLVLACLLPEPPAHAADTAVVTDLVKPAQVLRRGAKAWTFLNLTDEVREGDHVRTGSGARVELTLSDGRVVRVGQRSEIEIPRLNNAKDLLNIKIGLLAGRMWGNLLRKLQLERGEFLAVTTPTATLGIKGTQFGVDNDLERELVQVTVIQGVVAALPPGSDPGAPKEIPGPREVAPPQEITREEWEVLVNSQQKLILRPGAKPVLEAVQAEDLEDPWVSYNLARDRAMAQAPVPIQPPAPAQQ